MAYIDICLDPLCPKEVFDELAIVSFALANDSERQAYEDLFNSLDAKGVLGVLSYENFTPGDEYKRKVYIYPLSGNREMHSQLKTLIGSGIIKTITVQI